MTSPSLTPAGQPVGDTAGEEPPAVAPAGRLRVVHVIDSLAGSGGAENRLVDEVTALTDRFDQTVVRLFERDFLAARLADAGVPVVALGFTAGRAGWSWPVVGHRLTRTLRDLQPDVIHTSLFTGNLVGQHAGARLGVPVLSTFNRTGDRLVQRALQPGAASWRGRAMQAVSRRSARRAEAHYRAVGGYALETNCVSMRLPPGAATVVPRGVAIDADELTAASAARRGAFGLPECLPLFVNVARLVPEKAQHLLVEAFAHVRARLPGAHLAIAGPAGSAAPVVRDAIERAGVGDAVTLLGFRADARALVGAADVFVFSSMSEGSPGAVLEAMASRTPIAAFGIPPVAELTGGERHAWLAEPGDPAALAAAMLAAWRAPDRAERAAATQAWALRHYSLPAVAEQLGDLLEAQARGAVRRGSTTPW